MSPPARKRRTLPSLDRVLANQIRELREKRKVSQQRLAEMLGETQSTIARIESGERSIAVSEVFRIAAALDCPPYVLLTAGLTGEDVPVTPKHRLKAGDAHEWLIGVKPLPGGSQRLYMLEMLAVDMSDEELAQLAWDTSRTHRRGGSSDA